MRRRLLKSQFVTAESSRGKREKHATTYKSGNFDSELSSSGSKEVTPPIFVVNKDDNKNL